MMTSRPWQPRKLYFAAAFVCVLVLLGLPPWRVVAQPVKLLASPGEKKFGETWAKLDDKQAGEITLRHLHGLVRATHDYYDKHGQLPPAVVPNPALPPEKRLSGLVLLLPHLEYASRLKNGQEDGKVFDADLVREAKRIFGLIDLTKAWDDPANEKAARTIVPVFLAPAGGPFRDERGYAVTHFAFVRGADGKDNGPFTDREGLRILGGEFSITDGTSCTLAMGQVNSKLGPWIAAGASTSRHVYHPSAKTGSPTFGSQYDGACYFVNCDSYSYFLDLANSPPDQLRWLAGFADGHPIDTDKLPRFRTAADWKAARSALRSSSQRAPTLVAIVRLNGNVQAWFQSADKTVKIVEGKVFEMGAFRGMVTQIGERDIEVQGVNGKRWRVTLGAALATPPAAASSAPSTTAMETTTDEAKTITPVADKPAPLSPPGASPRQTTTLVQGLPLEGTVTGEQGGQARLLQTEAVVVTSRNAARRTKCSGREGVPRLESRRGPEGVLCRAAAWPAASPTEARRGSAERRNNGDWNQRCEHPTGRESGRRTHDPPKVARLSLFPPSGPACETQGVTRVGAPGTFPRSSSPTPAGWQGRR